MSEIHSCSYYCERPECIKAQRDELRERLAQPEHKPMHPTLQKMWEGYFDKCYKREPEQEPVAWQWKERINGDFDNWVVTFSEPPPYAVEQQPLYTTPPQRKPLTDGELADLWYKQSLDWLEFGRAIEAAHGIKES